MAPARCRCADLPQPDPDTSTRASRAQFFSRRGVPPHRVGLYGALLFPEPRS